MRQQETFQTGDVYRRISRDSEIKYVAHKDRPLVERQRRCAEGFRQGKLEISFLNCGMNFALRCFPPEYPITYTKNLKILSCIFNF